MEDKKVVIRAEHAAHGLAQIVGVGLIYLGMDVASIAIHHVPDYLFVKVALREVIGVWERQQRDECLHGAAVEVQLIESSQSVSDGQVAACPQKKKRLMRLSRLTGFFEGCPFGSASSFNGFCKGVSKGLKLCAIRISSFSSS